MDTIIIKIYGPDRFKIKNKTLFLPELSRRYFKDLSPTEKQSIRPYLRKFILRAPFQDGYRPKVEIFEAFNDNRDDVRYVMQITFSAPKLLWGNSVLEAWEFHLENILYALKQALSRVGIIITSDALLMARVTGLDVCKNVLLPREIRMQELLTELARVDISKGVDVTKVEFKHGGQVLHIFSGNVERVFYEKIADAMRPRNKRKDKGRINPERAFIEKYGLLGREIYRYEYRLKNYQVVMREINAALGRPPKTRIVLKDLFKPDLCKTLLLGSWHKLISRPENQLALLGPTNEWAFFWHTLTEARKSGTGPNSMNHALSSYALAVGIQTFGAKEVRRAIFSLWNTDHPERLTRKIRLAADLAKGLPYSDKIAFIERTLERYSLLTLDLLKQELQ